MSDSKRDEFFEEIFEYSQFSRCGLSEDDEEPSASCDCMDHPEDSDNTLRTGNYVTCILQRKEPPEYYDVDNPIWVIEYVACYDCPVASLFDRTDKDSPIAVVEGELVRGNDCLTLDPRFVWDLHVPDEQTVDV